ncbi:hypothetical protein [Granulicella aggregans]|uniref:hypothetical protein n=1 Tax=Granulicella aggregans TaxID=474949 RepID=UPI0021DF7BFE|nr:hypothetical protein [Granulicella aggregans]
MLFKAWSDAADIHGVFAARKILADYRPEVTISYNEANELGLKAQRAYLRHTSVCEECLYSGGKEQD